MKNPLLAKFRRMAAVTAVVILVGCFWAAAAMAQDGDPGEVTQAPVQNDADCGIVIYDWDGPVDKKSHGFPSEKPPRENFNWKKPVNYAAGELFYRAEIFSQPVSQDMRLQLCFWQPEKEGGNLYRRESCGPTSAVEGKKGQVVTWSREVERLWKKDGIGVDWSEPRSRASVAIKNSSRQPVSNYNGWNWNGENPAAWYPLHMRFTAVVVPQGGEFCGWDYYFTPSAVQMTSFGATSSAPESWPAALLIAAALALLTGTVFFLNGRNSVG